MYFFKKNISSFYYLFFFFFCVDEEIKKLKTDKQNEKLKQSNLLIKQTANIKRYDYNLLIIGGTFGAIAAAILLGYQWNKYKYQYLKPNNNFLSPN